MANVRIYWNLHKDCVSVLNKKTGLVIGHARNVILTDAALVVSQAGRQRAIRLNKRTFHAFADGTLTAADWIETKDSCGATWPAQAAIDATRIQSRGRRVSYNPFRDSSFHVAGAPVAQAEELFLTGTAKAECFI